jgi:hypothetical protein
MWRLGEAPTILFFDLLGIPGLTADDRLAGCADVARRGDPAIQAMRSATPRTG